MTALGGDTTPELDVGIATMIHDDVVAPGGRFDPGILGRLFDAVPMRVTAADAGGRFVYANRAALAMMDTTLEEVVGRTVREVLGDDMAERTAPMLSSLRAGETLQWSDWVTYRNGARHYVEQTYSPCFGREGGLVGFIAFIRDATVLKEREEALEARIAALNVAETISTAIIKTSIDPIMMVDEEGVLIDLNPAAMATFGYSRSNSVGRPIAELIIPPGLRQAHANGMERYTTTGISRVLDQRITIDAQRADGSLIPIELTISEIQLPQRRVFTAHLRDLSKAREAERQMEQQRERLHQAEKLSAMGSLLAGVAHELNNPLAILVAQSTLLMETAADAGQRRRAERIHAAADRAGRIVKSFLAMARQRPERRETTQINELVRATADMLAYGLRSHDVTLELDLDPNLPAIVADRDFIGQVIANLVINAQHALVDMEPPRHVSISTRRKNGHVRLVVSDNGPGVPEAIAARIFEPYFTTKPAGVGTGIGLSICKTVVESHGGSIGLDRSETGGARFTVLIPVAAAEMDATATEEPAARDGLTVLVVDDEADVRSSLAEMLELLGHHVADLVFVDLRMPGVDGLRFRDRAIALNPRLADRVVIMTGDAVEGPGAIARHAGEGAIPTMEKPFTMGDVRRVLAAFV
ncbi:MAG: hypothetical protein FD152_3491 [Xanthobacteraceae bacterium]|nr:MAG: hypothetical protein FD152_3491 [Xanthobacteraceae bacterium]